MAYFLSSLGLVLVIEGLPYFASPEKMKRLVEKIPSVPNQTLRLLGLISMIVGLFFIYLGRRQLAL